MAVNKAFLRGLQIFGALFGAKARKLSGIKDKDNKITDTVTFTAPVTVTLSVQVPDFLKKDAYFRVTGSVGANNQKLFRVKSVSGAVLTVDPSAPGVDVMTTIVAGESLTLDARMAVVHNNPLISKLNSEGSTIWNVANGAITTPADDCDLGLILAEHFHDDGAGGTPDKFTQNFVIADWFSSDAGDLFSFDIIHNLGITFPDIRVFDDSNPDETVILHRQRIIDSDTIRISVAQQAVDCRFEGRVCISK